MIYGYIRVSTDKQTLENQRNEIERYCAHENKAVDKFVEETISGTKEYQKRNLGKLIKTLNKGDTLIVCELSRLGRSFYMIMEILHLCLNKEVNIISIKENFVLSDNIQSKVVAFAFSLSAEIERKLISQRTKEGLYRVKQEGKKLGRPKGSKNKTNAFEINKVKILNLLKKGKSIYYIAKKIKVNRNTLYNYKRKGFII